MFFEFVEDVVKNQFKLTLFQKLEGAMIEESF